MTTPSPQDETVRSVEIRLQGIGVSPGIAHARAHVSRVTGFDEPDDYPISDPDEEVRRFENALSKTRTQIMEMQERISNSAGAKDASIFDAHLLVLEDSAVLDEVIRRIHKEKKNVEHIFFRTLSRYLESLKKINDVYLRERVVDIEDVARRVLRNLDGTQEFYDAEARATHKHLLIAKDLTPSDTANINREFVTGFATEQGSGTSHTAIMARSLNIPAVVGLPRLLDKVRYGDDVLIDGYNGLFILNPSPATLDDYEALAIEKSQVDEQLVSLRDSKSQTKDGRAIILSANAEFIHELPLIRENRAEGIGLYRTEFFYLAGHAPTEDEQYAVYAEVAEAVDPDGVIIRTFDVGGDKTDSRYELEPNPFLGWRGIRVSLIQTDLFKAQIRAILRASAKGKVRIMFPLVSSIDEIRQAKKVFAECEKELEAEGIPFDKEMEVGMMIEVPSAAVIADSLAKEVDFFSIGTNDLVQYTVAVDRTNEHVASLYQTTHPAVLRLMKIVVDAARANGIWVGVCGEMAGDVRLTPLMVGLDMEELSVGAPQLPRVKHAVRSLDSETCKALVEQALQMSDAESILELSSQEAMRYYPELLA